MSGPISVRIAYDHQIFTRQNYGGISRYFANLAGEVSNLGVETHIFAPKHINHYLNEVSPNIVKGRFTQSYSKGTRALAQLYNVLQVNKQIKKWQPDIVHETFYSHKGDYSGTHKTVATVHDMIPELYPELYKSPALMSKKKFNALERADQIICVSENTRKDLLRLMPIDESKVAVVHLGGDVSIDMGNTLEKPPVSGAYLMYTGQRHGYKNFAGFIEAVASSNKLINDFKIVCFGGGAFSEQEKAHILSLGFQSGQVIQFGGSDQTLHLCLRGASAFVFPSLYEGFGIPPLEAMSCGCPVVCSNVSSIPEVAGNAAEYFSPSSKLELANAIENVVYSATRTAELVNAGNARVRQMSWETCAQKTHQIYSNL